MKGVEGYPVYMEKALAREEIPLIDIIYGHLKFEIVELEKLESTDRHITGYMQCLLNTYTLIDSMYAQRGKLLNG